MLSRLKFFWAVLFIMICVDIAYGNEIKGLKDLLNQDISLVDKLRYLDSIKNDKNHSFSTQDIYLLSDIFTLNDPFIPLHKTQKEEEPNKDLMNEIRSSILEILLRDDIDEDVLTFSQMTGIVEDLCYEIRNTSLSGHKKRRYLALKILIKINRLRPNTDDAYSKNSRQMVTDSFISLEQKDLMGISEQLEGRYNSEALSEIIEKRKKEELYYSKGNVWVERTMVETHIFDPILSLSKDLDNDDWYGDYIEKDEKVLYDYEKYLLENIKYFPITDNLKNLVEAAFLKTNVIEFKRKYIEAMFVLDMPETLIKIISNSSIDWQLRKLAIDVSIKLLDQTDVLYFKKFSTSLLRIMENIVSTLDEKEEGLIQEIQEKISIIQSRIDKHDDMKDLRQIIFSSDISVEKKIWYLNTLAELRFSFSKKDLSFIINVLNDSDLDLSIKARASTIVLYGSKPQDRLDVLTTDDIETLVFLWEIVDESGRDLNTNVFGSEPKVLLWATKNISVLLTDEIIIKQSGKFGLWKNLMEYINKNKDVDDSIRKLAMKTGLDLLAKIEDYDTFSSTFLESLHRISLDTEESNDLKNVADYILVKIKRGDFSLKNACSDCSLKMVLGY